MTDATASKARRAAVKSGRQVWSLWLLRRVGFGVVTVLAVSALIFLATHALPGDVAQTILGTKSTPTQLAALRRQLGLDRPLYEQYFSWLGGVAHGNLGASLTSGVAVSSLLGVRVVNSLYLMVAAAAIAIPLSIVMGVATALRRDRWFDRVLLVTSLGITALPEFGVGLVLVLLFSTTVFHLLPAVALIPPGSSPLSYPAEMVLPVLTLVVVILPYLYRQVRAPMIEALESEYVTMARLKGMPERIVTRRHALPNALIPVVQASALVLAYLLGGLVVVEFLFGYAGIGSLLVEAIQNRDVPLIEGTVLVFAVGVVLLNLLADVLTVYLSPRLRTRMGT